MKINIRYSAHFQYAEKASFSPHRARLFPRRDLSTRIERIAFSTDPSADVQYSRDLFDNLTATCVYPGRLDQLDFDLEIDAVLQELNPFHFLLDSHAMDLPFEYLPAEAEVLGPFRGARQRTGALPAPLRPGGRRATVEAIVSMNSWLHENIKYERREEGDPFPPEKTLKDQKGSCRDFAMLLAEILRGHGLACRLVSGYLWEDGKAEHASNAFHAWVETYLPGAGWTGLDPTNGVLCDHHFLATAVGLDPAEIAPIVGHYYGEKTIPSSLRTGLTILTA